ncbi:hypothetical protein [Ilumatobacter coccineus]|nr:hypothetical protein [Ilumatobacter coccineus]
MNRLSRIVIAALSALVGLAALPAATTSAAPEPPPFIWSQVIVDGIGSSAILPTISDQLFPLSEGGEISGTDAFLTGVTDPHPGPNPPDDFCQDPPVTEYDPGSVRDRRCELTTGPGDYFLVVGPAPDGYETEYWCDQTYEVTTIDGMEGIAIELLDGQRPSCFVRFERPIHLSSYVEVVDEDAAGGPFDAATLFAALEAEAYTDPGGEQVLADGDCVSAFYPLGDDPAAQFFDCLLPAPGDYQTGLAGVPNGMVLVEVSCYDPDEGEDERIDDPLGAFTFVDTVIYCDHYYRFVRQTFSVDVVVTNDDDGTAVGSDFEIEVYDAGGALVATGFDPAPNDESASAEFTLGIGDYQFGISGPDGYESTVTITVSELATEVIDDASAAFTIGEFSTVSAVIAMDDQTAPTTTVPPTTAVPTTAAPTTVAPTTAAPDPTTTERPTTELPATGPRGPAPLLTWGALGLLLLGAGIALSARRPTTR